MNNDPEEREQEHEARMKPFHEMLQLRDVPMIGGDFIILQDRSIRVGDIPESPEPTENKLT